jgi:site-specific DNA-methyltransferase (adenine-specific)
LKQAVRLFENQRTGWIERKAITTNPDWIDEWKVLITYAQGTSSAIETKFLSKPVIAEPGTACTETYLVAGHFESETEAANYAKYLSTRFVRFLVSLRRLTQHAARGVYAFVPDLPLDQEWTDAKLYDRYGLTKDEVAFIESQVSEHASDLPDDSDVEDE